MKTRREAAAAGEPLYFHLNDSVVEVTKYRYHEPIGTLVIEEYKILMGPHIGDVVYVDLDDEPNDPRVIVQEYLEELGKKLTNAREAYLSAVKQEIERIARLKGYTLVEFRTNTINVERDCAFIHDMDIVTLVCDAWKLGGTFEGRWTPEKGWEPHHEVGRV